MFFHNRYTRRQKSSKIKIKKNQKSSYKKYLTQFAIRKVALFKLLTGPSIPEKNGCEFAKNCVEAEKLGFFSNMNEK